MNASNDRHELSRLIVAITERSLSEEEHEQLSQILRTDAGAREEYVQHLMLHGQLQISAEELLSHFTPDSTGALRDSNAEAREAQSSQLLKWPSANQTWVMIAACVVLTATVIIGFKVVPESLRPERTTASSVTAVKRGGGLDFVARLSGTRNAKWDDSQSTKLGGSLLRAGQELRLAGGAAEITFGSGALVIVEGPTRFTITSKNGGQLHSGKLAANVPESAIGFRVRTPTATIVDRGTKFGVEVTGDGATRAQVLKGEIELYANQHSRTANGPRLLVTGQAAQVIGDVIHSLAVEQPFVTQLADAKTIKVSPDQISGLCLWLRADALDLQDGDEVTWWHDKSATVKGALGRIAPTYCAKVINGKPVVRFDGKTNGMDLMVDDGTGATYQDLRLTSGATWFAAIAIRDSNSYRASLWNDSDGLVDLVASNVPSPYTDEPALLRTSRHRNIPLASTLTVPKDFFLLTAMQSNLADNADNMAQIFVNGKLEANGAGTNAGNSMLAKQQIGIGKLPSSTKPQYLGIDPLWGGDLAELLVFNRVLNTDERGSVERYLADKFGLSLDGDQPQTALVPVGSHVGFVR